MPDIPSELEELYKSSDPKAILKARIYGSVLGATMGASIFLLGMDPVLLDFLAVPIFSAIFQSLVVDTVKINEAQKFRENVVKTIGLSDYPVNNIVLFDAINKAKSTTIYVAETSLGNLTFVDNLAKVEGHLLYVITAESFSKVEPSSSQLIESWDDTLQQVVEVYGIPVDQPDLDKAGSTQFSEKNVLPPSSGLLSTQKFSKLKEPQALQTEK